MTTLERHEDAQADPPATGGARRRFSRALSFRTIGAVYLFIALFVLFSIWVPGTFLKWSTWQSLFASQSITALTAVALTIPLAAGTFNLAIGTQVGIGSIVAAALLSKVGLSIPITIVLTLLSGGFIGWVTAVLIVRFRIDSFIATLGLSSVLTALTNWISNSQSILNLGTGYQKLATNEIFGLTIPVYVMLVVALMIWYVLERTRAGRRIYATGGNIDAARLAGVRTSLTIVLCLVACGIIAAAAGILESSNLATGDPTIGPAYLLPAFAATFLGSTQFRPGRYNVWGTVFAVYLLGMGVTGLQLGGAPVWIPDLFDGVALVIAVGLAKRQGAIGQIGATSWLRRFQRHVPEAEPAD